MGLRAAELGAKLKAHQGSRGLKAPAPLFACAVPPGSSIQIFVAGRRYNYDVSTAVLPGSEGREREVCERSLQADFRV